MEIKDIQKNTKGRIVPISFRISKEHSDFMKEKNISPTKLFIKSLENLMRKK